MLKNTATATITANNTTPPADAPIMMPRLELEVGAGGVDVVAGVFGESGESGVSGESGGGGTGAGVVY